MLAKKLCQKTLDELGRLPPAQLQQQNPAYEGCDSQPEHFSRLKDSFRLCLWRHTDICDNTSYLAEGA